MALAEAIVVNDLRKTYPGEVVALDGLSLTVESGTVFALVGPNGAGKSTTVKILTTLSRPDSGQARVAGIDVLERPDRVRRAIGVVGQKADTRHTDWNLVLTRTGLLAALFLVCASLATQAFRSYQRSV